MNWALLGDGQHTIVAYDNGVKFASATFDVTTFDEEYVKGAEGDFTLRNFPRQGEISYFEWNESTQHMELVDFARRSTPVHGRCGTARNTCQAGTPNAAAVADTSTHYRWRCDGRDGGRNSGVCQVAKPRQPDPPQTGLAALLGTWDFTLRFTGQSPLTRPYLFQRVATGANGIQGIVGQDPLDNSVFVVGRVADLDVAGFEEYTYVLIDADDLGQGVFACFTYLMTQTGTNQLSGSAVLTPASQPTLDGCDFTQGVEGTFSARRTRQLTASLLDPVYRFLPSPLTTESPLLPERFLDLGEALTERFAPPN